MKPLELISLRCITSRIEEKKNFYACYQVGPFSIGQSLTVANTLRRSLLTELQGLAILEVEFQGVTHEYSIIPGIRESILEILLNLKQLVFTSNHRISRPVYCYLKSYGPGIVKAKSLQLPAYIQCVDPEGYIATLSYNGFLNLKCSITQSTESGHNYPQTVQKDALKKKIFKDSRTRSNLAEKNFFSLQENQKFFQLVSQIPTKEIDEEKNNSRNLKKNIIIPLDTIFVPVKKVNFRIEVDEKLQQPKEFILFEIWTNGSLHPRQALHDATKKLLFLLYPIQKAMSLNRMKKFIPFLRKKRKYKKKKLEQSKSQIKKIVPIPKHPITWIPVFVKRATYFKKTLQTSTKNSVFRKVQILRKVQNTEFFKKKRKMIVTKINQKF